MAISGGSSNVISLPKGGGALHGIGEKFSPDLHTGSGNFTVPLSIPPGRNGFQPQLNLVYSTGQGNGPFGLGWSLSIPGVSRKTFKGIPRYRDGATTIDDQDVFILSGAEDLVPVSSLTVSPTLYRPRTEGLFASIAHHFDAFSDFWEVRSKDGLVSRYGTAEKLGQDPGVVANPAAPVQSQIYSWKLTSTVDPFGNRIEYEYERDAGEAGPHNWDQVYLKRIRYADYESDGELAFLVWVTLDYEDNREDAFSEYRSGFEIRTTRRCTTITVSTHADEDRLVRRYDFSYLDTRSDLVAPLPLNGASLLSQVIVTGFDAEKTESLPPLEFAYTEFQPGQHQFGALQGAALPATSLANPDLELVDLFGQGLPDILEMSGAVRYWRNLGAGQFDFPRPMATAPAGVALADPGVQLIDANGNGRTDLLVTTGMLSGYYPLRFGGLWDSLSFRPYPLAPSFNLKDPEVKLIDLDGDGVTDAVRCGTNLECFFNHATKGWHQTLLVSRSALDGFPLSFSDPHVKWGDMSGDGLHDIVVVHDGNVAYWPNLGYGRWAKRITMLHNPDLPFGYDPKRILVGDIDGDGLADIVYVDNNRVTVWINKSGNRWSDPIVILGTPSVSNLDAIRLADMQGTGISGVLWSKDFAGVGQSSLSFLDFTGGIKPYLLNEMDNHIGALTRVEYAPSVRFYLEDQKNLETRWRTVLPFPVQVVSRVEVIDEISKGKFATEYRYHHGYWDGAEREFRGFGMVEQYDTESFTNYDSSGLHGDSDFAKVDARFFSAPTLRKTWFHQGPIGDESGDWEEPDGSGEYWFDDPQILDQLGSINAFLNLFPSTSEGRRMQRDALRTLRGSVLRTELYALDGSTRENLPYTVSESSYGLIEVDPPAAGDTERPRIFFPHVTSQRTTQWERGDDPKTQFSFTHYTDENNASSFDPFGRPSGQTQIACPRGWRHLDDTPTEPFLATRTRTVYAQPNDPLVYIHTHVAKSIDYEITSTLGKRVSELVALTDSDAKLKVIGQTLSFYDGEAFEGLPLGEVGLFGAVTRTESLAFNDEIVQQAYGTEIPPYLEPTGNLAWTADYPLEFRTLLPRLAGYTFRAGSADPADPKGYFVNTDRRRYDFQTKSSPTPRGFVLETLDPLHDATTNPSGHRTLIAYDKYQFLPERVTDVAGLTMQATHDYRVLQPIEVTDPNGNRSRFTFSPLGLLESSFIRGKNPTEGDQDRPSARMEYGFLAFENSPPGNPRPIFVRTIRHIHHDSEGDVPLPERDETITTVEYSDGFGRMLQTRTQGEEVRFGDEHFGGGESVLPAKQSDGAGGDVLGRRNTDVGKPNVVVSGWQIYDNKAQVVEKYGPFFSEGWDYGQPDDSKTGQKVAMFYDPRGHAIRTLNPDGSEQQVIYGVPGTIAVPDLAHPELFEPTPWEAYTYDANDNAGHTHPAESARYQHHWNTPASILIDALGRTIKAVERNRDAPANPGDPLPPIQEFHTRTTYDIRGNPLTVRDAITSPAEPLGRKAFQHIYDYANRNLRIDSIDAGLRKTVLDAAGGVIEQRDSKGALILHSYDNLNRPLRLWARDGEGQKLTLRERLEYGDAGSPNQPAADRAANRAANGLGRLIRYFDEAGFLAFEAYDFKGNLLEKTRHVVSNAAVLAAFNGPPPAWKIDSFRVDWTNPAAVPLDAKTYVSTVSYDALSRMKLMTYPEDVENTRRKLRPHYNRAGALERVALEQVAPGGGTISDTFVERIAYNAKGQRALIAYGNGVMTRHAYDPKTFRLTHLRTEKFGKPTDLTYRHSGQALQEFGYEYDLAGNIRGIHDRTPDSGIKGSTLGLDALDREFVYDALYRLRSATGRESDRPPEAPWDDAPRSTDLTKTRSYTEQYRYDAVGNIEELKHLSNGVGFARVFDLVSGNNRLSKLNIGATAFAYQYDANGNMTQEATSRHFEWDSADRMRVYRTQTDASEPSVHAHYLYDAGGQRVKKLVRKQGGQIEVTVYIDRIFEYQRIVRAGAVEENNTLHVMDNQSRIALVRVGNPFANDSTPTVKYQLGDHLGSSNVVIDNTGLLVNREEYTPYGETSFGSFARKRYRFTGKERDEESGLNYHGARYYAPWLGRWTSSDPAGMVDGINLYVYAHNNPLSQIDPGGTQTCNPDVASCQAPRENPNSANQSSSEIQRNDEFEQMNQENAKTSSNLATTPTQKSDFSLSTEFGEAYQEYQSSLATPRPAASVPTLGIAEALKYSWQHGSTKDKAVLTLTGVGAAAGFVPYWGDYISLATSVGVLALDPSLSNLGDVGLDAVGAALPFVPALGTLRHVDKVVDAANLIKKAEKTHITYVLKDAPDSIRYVGRAQGYGSPEKVLYGRLTKNHPTFEAHPNLVAEVVAEHKTLKASKGAESVYHDYFKEKGHKLLNSPLSPPGGSSTAARRAKTHENIGVFFMEW
ncbi:MAG: SpvB/TcaC N-terminal domain-containing protein [Acidobacteriota bacterium]